MLNRGSDANYIPSAWLKCSLFLLIKSSGMRSVSKKEIQFLSSSVPSAVGDGGDCAGSDIFRNDNEPWLLFFPMF